MRICNRCGEQNADVAFCKKCGSPLSEDSVVQADVAEPVQEPSLNTSPKKTPNKGMELSVAGLCCLLFELFVTTVMSIILSSHYADYIIDTIFVNALNIGATVLSYLSLITGAGLSVAGMVMTLANKNLESEAKRYCKIFTVTIAVVCSGALFLNIFGYVVRLIMLGAG